MKIELAKTEVVHFVGIGGIGMSGLSLIMRGKGFKVQGSDLSSNKNIERLRKEKIKKPRLTFPFVIKKNKIFNRKNLQIYLEKNNIQTRTIFTGNILKQPVMKNRIYKKHKNCDHVANNVMKNGILIGCHHGMTINDVDIICKVFSKIINK